jgi:hypothetical protein
MWWQLAKYKNNLIFGYPETWQLVVSLMVNELTLWRASVRQIAVVTNKYIPYIVKFVFYKGIYQFHFDVKVVKSRGSQNRKQELK